jgi:uncharacterized repeat protein (TIGR02543 family)
MLKKINLLFLSLLILGILMITSCTPKLPVMVTFDSQGGSAVEAQMVDHGELVTEPAAPTKTGSTFGGWYKEPECTNPWNFDSDTLTADVTLYAKWTTNSYTVTFKKNDTAATGKMTAQTIASGSSAKLKACAFSKTGWTFAGWATTSGGTVKYSDGDSYTMGTANANLYAKWNPPTTYSLRDIGPAGGLIFYDKGSYSDGWRYLEAAPSDQSSGTEWGCFGVLISGADGTAVGTGKQNTSDIEAGCTTPGTAADICANLSLGGYDDWFLPSKDELNLMYENLKVFGIGGFSDGYYWSSSEGSENNAWYQNFGSGPQGANSKYAKVRVRAVRAF